MQKIWGGAGYESPAEAGAGWRGADHPKVEKRHLFSDGSIPMADVATDRAISEKITFLTTFIFCGTLNSFSIKSYIQKTEGGRPFDG